MLLQSRCWLDFWRESGAITVWQDVMFDQYQTHQTNSLQTIFCYEFICSLLYLIFVVRIRFILHSIWTLSAQTMPYPNDTKAATLLFSLSIYLLIIFLMTEVLSIKCQKIAKVPYSDHMFYQDNSTKPKDVQFTITYDKKAANPQIWEGGTREFWHFCLKNPWNN